MRRPDKLVGQGLIALLLIIALHSHAHTLFFKPERAIVEPGSQLTIPLMNGTFLESENKVTANRMIDATVIRPDGEEIRINNAQWSHEGRTTYLTSNFQKPGTYVIGVGTLPMLARMAPEDFNFYLRYEGLDDDIQQRRELGENQMAAAERYQKFAKTILQVGAERSKNYGTALGYPVEIVPLQNPYSLSKGDLFKAKILKDGKPLVNELVYASHEGHYDASEEGIFNELVGTRSDENGEIEFILQDEGKWYIRFIHLTRMGDREHWYSSILITLGVDEPRIPYQSLWATLTFEVR